MVVGLCVERSPEMVIGLLGILKAGGAYLPLDAGLSARTAGVHAGRRRRRGAGDAVRAGSIGCLLYRNAPRSSGSTRTAAIARHPAPRPPLDLDPRHPAYVIYTSGSTGTPKAVVVEHASLTNKMLALGRDFDVDERFRAAVLISSAFDPSIEQTLLPLMGGGAAVVVSDAVRESPVQFWRQVQRDGVTFVSCVPSFFESVLRDAPEGDIRWIIWRWVARPSPASSAGDFAASQVRADHQSLRSDRDHDRRDFPSCDSTMKLVRSFRSAVRCRTIGSMFWTVVLSLSLRELWASCTSRALGWRGAICIVRG